MGGRQHHTSALAEAKTQQRAAAAKRRDAAGARLEDGTPPFGHGTPLQQAVEVSSLNNSTCGWGLGNTLFLNF